MRVSRGVSCVMLGAGVFLTGPVRAQDAVLANGASPYRLAPLRDRSPAKRFRHLIDRSARLMSSQTRYLAEQHGPGWWISADVSRRHSREWRLNSSATYALTARRALGGDIWLGIDASGRFEARSGAPRLDRDSRSYIGPSLTFAPARADGNVEMGLGWAQRMSPNGPGSGPRLNFRLRF